MKDIILEQGNYIKEPSSQMVGGLFQTLHHVASMKFKHELKKSVIPLISLMPHTTYISTKNDFAAHMHTLENY